MGESNQKQNHLVLFAIYELLDQNRDEGVGNFQTLKKLHRIDGVYTFISKYSVRHHLFNELKDTADWKESAVTVSKDVIQFNLIEDDIITSPELDAFGYMYTLGGENGTAITRKAAVGLTDVVSLEPYTGDSAFYANHDMVQRAQKQGQDASPNPYGKEEHLSLYKGGMTINLNRLGIDEWIVNQVDKTDKELKINLSGGDKTIPVEPIAEENIPKIIKEVKEKYGALIEQPKYFKAYKGKGYIIYGKIRESDRCKVIFVIPEEERKKRVRDLIENYINGFKFQVGGRDYAMEPLFWAVAITKSPLQVFFPHIGVTSLGNSRFKIIGLAAPLSNSKVEKVYLGWNKDKVEVDMNLLGEFKNKLVIAENKEKVVDKVLADIVFSPDTQVKNQNNSEGKNHEGDR